MFPSDNSEEPEELVLMQELEDELIRLETAMLIRGKKDPQLLAEMARVKKEIASL